MGDDCDRGVKIKIDQDRKLPSDGDSERPSENDSDQEHQHQFVFMHTVPQEYRLSPSGWVCCNWCDGIIMMASDARSPQPFLHCRLRNSKGCHPRCFESDLTVLDLVHKRELLGMDWSQDVGMHPRFAPKEMCDTDMCWDCYARLSRAGQFTAPPPEVCEKQY